MNPSSEGIVEASLQLSATERAVVVQQLLDSLSPDAEKAMDDAWAAELDRRLAAFQQGDADAVPWSRLREQK